MVSPTIPSLRMTQWRCDALHFAPLSIDGNSRLLRIHHAVDGAETIVATFAEHSDDRSVSYKFRLSTRLPKLAATGSSTRMNAGFESLSLQQCEIE